MNSMMKEAIASTGTEWASTVPLVLFVTFFLAVIVWTMLYAQPPAEVE